MFFNRLLPLALLPVVVGFVGLHLAQRGSYGRLGTAGFAIVLVGFTLIIAGSVGEFWFFNDQPYGQPNGRNASWTLFLLGHSVLAVGTLLFGIVTVLFGIVTVRAKMFPGDLATLFALLGVGVIVPFIGAFIFALPFVWLGYLLYSGNYDRARQPSRVS